MHSPLTQPNQHQTVNNHSYYSQEQSTSNIYNSYGHQPVQNHQNGSPAQYQSQHNLQSYYNPNNRSYNQTQTSMHYQSPIMSQNEMYKNSTRIPYTSQAIPAHNQIPVQQQIISNQQMQIQNNYQQPNYNSYQEPQYVSQPHCSNDFQYQQQQSNAEQIQPTQDNAMNNYSLELPENGRSTETNILNSYVDDIEEQIEASTIVLENGSAKPQKITIKYRKEKAETLVPSSEPETEPSVKAPKSRKSKKTKAKDDGQQSLVNGSSSNNGSKTDIINLTNNDTEDQLNESLSNDSYSIPSTVTKTSKSKRTRNKKSKFEPSYLQNDESCSNSEFTSLYGKYSNETNDGTIPNGSDATRNVRFNFAGATSTPIRSTNNNNNNNNNHLQSPCSSARTTYKSNDSSSKSSTPRNTFKSLRKRSSNLSLLNHTLNENEDSMTSFSMVEPNSFFETENNDELRQQRLDKALKTIDEHFKRPHIDPFSTELCKAFLTKANFPSHEHSEFYKLSNALLSKLSNTKTINIGDIRFNIEKEIGRGAFGSVYRGVNSNTADTVALKYQKPPNTWELYICTEVAQRIKDSDLVG